MLDLFPFLRATLRASTYFSTDYEGFHDSQDRFKVFREAEAPSTESPYITIERTPADVDQRNDWATPTFLFHVTGKDTEWKQLWALVYKIRDIFKDLNKLSTLAFTVTPNSSDDTFTLADHGLQDGIPVVFTTTGTLPTGISGATTYYVTNARRNTFQIQANGSVVNFTTNGTGVLTATFGPIIYQLIGKPTFSDGRNPVTDEVTASVALTFGLDC